MRTTREQILERCSVIELRMLKEIGYQLPHHLAIGVAKLDRQQWENVLADERRREAEYAARTARRIAAA